MFISHTIQTDPKADEGCSERDRIRLAVTAKRFIAAAFTARKDDGMGVIDAT